MTKELLEHLLPVSSDPETVFHALFANHDYALWFDEHGERGRGVSYLGAGIPLALTSKQWRTEVRAAHQTLALDSTQVEGLPLGILLVLPYELAYETLSLPSDTEDTPALPIALVVKQVVRVEHDTGLVSAYGVGSRTDTDWLSFVERTQQALTAGGGVPKPVVAQGLELSWRDDTTRYREIIRLAREAIRQGDAYQLCVTTQLSVAGNYDPIALHRLLRTINPTHHQALMRLGDTSIVSASPETFIDLSPDRTLTTRPIKGTRPRGATPERDQELAEELVASEKERAENLMIVDLMRNDLSRVCEVGSVCVPELLRVETYASVHQLVSTVQGTLRDGLDVIDVIGATFPAGSMTGAPKRRAVQLLAGWESGPRGFYSGAYGVWRADGSCTLAMTIRSAVVGSQGLTLGTGGGITALSDPDLEIAEVGVKALPFLKALGQTQVQYS
jgi:anthranilate synthase component 1